MLVRDSVTAKLDILVTGDNAGPSKTQSAKGKGIKITDAEGFKHFIETGEIQDYFGTSSASGRYWSSTDNLSYANPSVENVLTQANQNDSITKSQPRLLQDGYAKFKLDYAPDYELGHNILNYIIELSDGVNPPQIAEIQIFVDDIVD